MRLFSVIVLVGALSGCAALEEVGRAVKDTAADVAREIPEIVQAAAGAVAEQIPEATKEIVNDPSPGTAAKVGVGLLITFVTGAAGYFAIRKRRA